MQKIIFYAPLGNKIEGHKNGGAESGCRKTLAILQKAGYEVIVIEKPAKSSESNLGKIKIIFNFLNVWLIIISLMLKNRNSILHIAGFYLNQIYFEKALICTANFLKVKSIYEIRNGGMIQAYDEAGFIYKWLMKSSLINSSLVLCQGVDYVHHLEKNLGLNSVYYPNYVMSDYISDNQNKREFKTTVKLVFVGRVVPDKNIEFILAICANLRILEIPFKLDIIGGFERQYHNKLLSIIKDSNLSASIFFHGRKEYDEIYKILKESHFFLFPSKEKREGHSNSLTEAMSCGVVPIASNIGFNASVIDNKNLVINEFDPALYAKVVADVWNSNEWKKLSDLMYTRVIKNYTETIVGENLLGAYRDLINDIT